MDPLESAIRKTVLSLEEDTIEMLRQLVQIPSITGEEQEAQSFVKKVYELAGLQVEEWFPLREELRYHSSFSDDGLPLGSRPVVVGRREGTGEGSSLILNGHVDVVPPGNEEEWTAGCWSGELRDDWIWGRGSCDMKGGLICGVIAIEALRRLEVELAGDVILESVIGEETGGAGTLAAILRGYRADAAIILEPTGLEICPSGAGALSFRLTVPGLAAHGALRKEGVSAVEKFYPFFQALNDLESVRQERFRHPWFAEGSLVAPISIGKIQAGNWPSTVPESLIAEGRYGVLPGENVEDARRLFENTIAQAAEADEWLRNHHPTVEWFEGQFAPGETRPDAPLIAMLKQSHEAICGKQPAIHGVPYGSDLRFFTNDAGMDAVLYGPGDVRLAHSSDERISLEQVMEAAAVIALIIYRWCGRK